MSVSEIIAEKLTELQQVCKQVEKRVEELERREQEVEKRERMVKESTSKCASLEDEDVVTFNVGGQLHLFTVAQIEAYPESMLACYISERWNKRTKGSFDPKERIYTIPRSARLFRFVDDFLRGHDIHVEQEDQKAVEEEFLYYGLSMETTKQLDWQWIGGFKGSPCGHVVEHTIDGDTRFRGPIWTKGKYRWTLRIDQGKNCRLGIVHNMNNHDNGPNSHGVGISLAYNNFVRIKPHNLKAGDTCSFILDLDAQTLQFFDQDNNLCVIWTIESKSWSPYVATLYSDVKITLLETSTLQ